MRALWSSPSQRQQQPDSKSPNQLALTERPIPALAPSTILVKVSASGVNPSDVASALMNAFGMFQPRIPGRDFAGVVYASNNPALPPGTAVYGTSGNVLSFTCDGTAADYVLVPEDAVVPKPRSLSMAQAAVVGVPYTAALLALEATHTQRGADRVLVLGGTGAVGTAVARIARCWGCSVVTTGRRDDADINIITDPNLHGISKYFENGKADVIIDTIGSTTLMSEAMKVLALKGRYCVLAGLGETPKYDLNLVDLYRKNHTICGINSIPHQPAEMAERMKRLAEMFDEDGLEPPAEDGLTLLPIEKGVEAYKQAAQFKGRKHVIVFDDK